VNSESSRELARRIIELFFIRRDVYGLETESGWKTVKKPVTINLVMGHLQGKYCLGAHPIGKKGECKWIGWEADSASLTPPLISRILKSFDRRAILIHETGGRSIHVKVFFRYAIKSRDAYWLARRVAEGLRGVEFFPKQPSIGRGYGNFMRLPLGRHRKTGRIGVLIQPKSLFEVVPCRPPAPPTFSSIAEECPFRVREARMVDGKIELLDTYSCTYHDGSIGRCSQHLCPMLRRKSV